MIDSPLDRQDRRKIDPRAGQVLKQAQVCRLALSVDDRPYLVPVSFGFEEGRLFIHSGRDGMKLEMLERNPLVCFEAESDVALLKADGPCQFSMRYRSVIGWGRAHELSEPGDKRRGLDAIVRQYGGEPGEYSPASLDRVAVFAIEIDEMTYKDHHIED